MLMVLCVRVPRTPKLILLDSIFPSPQLFFYSPQYVHEELVEVSYECCMAGTRCPLQKNQLMVISVMSLIG